MYQILKYVYRCMLDVIHTFLCTCSRHTVLILLNFKGKI